MKEELKNTIYKSVSTLRKLFAKLKNIDDCKYVQIIELETLVATTKAELLDSKNRTEDRQGTPPSIPRREQVTPTECEVAPSGVAQGKLYTNRCEQARLYFEVLVGNLRQLQTHRYFKG